MRLKDNLSACVEPEYRGERTCRECYFSQVNEKNQWTGTQRCWNAGCIEADTVGVGTCEGSFHESSDLSSGRVPLYYCKGTNKSIFMGREARFCPLCGMRIIKEVAE